MPILEVQNITKRFGETEVLRGISFTMERGEVLVIIGSSGSGKTTLLRSLNFLERPDGGRILVNGEVVFDAADARRLTEEAQRQRRLHFGMVFQNFNLFPQYTVLKNVTLAPTLAAPDRKAGAEEIERTARELIARVGLSDKLGAYPCELSGGQQQRVAIARALAMKPDILCFDEPTSALDPALTGEVLRVIRQLKTDGAGRTMIVVTHEMEFAAAVADRVLFMSGGVIEEAGTPEEVFGAPKSEKTRAFLSSGVKNF